MLPSKFLNSKNYPAVHNFITNHLDMQFGDVREMMKLPLPKIGIKFGCNFAAAAILCNLMCGISEVIYTPKQKCGSGQKFKELLKEFYPWEAGQKKARNAKVIYDLVRNSLAHCLAVRNKKSLPITIRKNPLSEIEIDDMEQSSIRPAWVPLAVVGDSKGYFLSVPGLYWGVFHLLEQLAKDTTQMRNAEKKLQKWGVGSYRPGGKPYPCLPLPTLN